MSKDVKKDILKCLKTHAEGAKLPRNISFTFDGDILHLILSKQGVFGNMQTDGAAFEGWALIIKTYWNTDEEYKVCIDVNMQDEKLPDPRKVFSPKSKYKDKGHYGRFLYRAKHFWEEFDWVKLSPEVQTAVDLYFEKIEKDERTNHLPGDEAGINEHPEIQMEALFSNHPNELIKLTGDQVKGKVNRQLGCWMESKKDNTLQYFTASRSAMDLWNLTDNTLNIFELKTITEKNNAKVGILSELFFYMEYCNDLYVNRNGFNPRPGNVDDKNDRGYYLLTQKEIKEVVGYFLTNKYHPLVEAKVVDELNRNRSGIKYVRLKEYNYKYMSEKYKKEIEQLLEQQREKKRTRQ